MDECHNHAHEKDDPAHENGTAAVGGDDRHIEKDAERGKDKAVFLLHGKIKGAGHTDGEHGADGVVLPPARADVAADDAPLRVDDAVRAIGKDEFRRDDEPQKEPRPEEIVFGRLFPVDHRRHEKVEREHRAEEQKGVQKIARGVLLIADAAEEQGGAEDEKSRQKFPTLLQKPREPHRQAEAQKKEHDKNHDDGDEQPQPAFGKKHRIGVINGVIAEGRGDV